jgi:serine/threonine-protein kinase RsbW
MKPREKETGRTLMAMGATRSAILRAAEEEIPPLLDRMIEEGRDAGAPESLLSDLRLCLDELLVNVVNHAKLPSEAVIEVRYRLDPGGVWAEIADPGPPFDPLSLPDPNVDAPLDDRVPGGLGIYFVRSLMDEVVYERRQSRNLLRVAKRAAASPSPATV